MSEIIQTIGIIISAIIIIFGYFLTDYFNRRSNLSDKLWDEKRIIFKGLISQIYKLIKLTEFEHSVIIKPANSPYPADKTAYGLYNFIIRDFLRLFYPNQKELQCYEKFIQQHSLINNKVSSNIIEQLITDIGTEFIFLKFTLIQKIKIEYQELFLNAKLIKSDYEMMEKIDLLFEEIVTYLFESNKNNNQEEQAQMFTDKLNKLVCLMVDELERTRKTEGKLSIDPRYPTVSRYQPINCIEEK